MWGYTGVLVALCLAGISTAQPECSHVYSEAIHCLDDGDLQLSCPDLHWVLIKDTTYYVSESGTCPPDDSGACVAPGAVTEVKETCHQRQECTVSVTRRSDSVCPGSTHYVWVQYQCEPLHNTNGNARAVDLCNAADPFVGTLVHVDSHPAALFGSYIYSRDNCACVITIPPRTDVLFRLPFMLKQGATQGQCSQKVIVWDETESFEFCGKKEVNLTCSDRERNFRVLYSTEDDTVGVIFLLQVYVPYQSSGLALSCGIPPDDLDDLFTTAVPAITSEAEVTTHGEFLGLDESWKLPLIVGMVGLALLIMIIVILFLCIRARKEREAKEPAHDDASDRQSNYQFVTDIYVDGDQKSQLVLDKKNAMMRI